MPKAKINRRRFESRVARQLEKIKGKLESKRLLDMVGKQIVKDIKRETRAGRGFKTSQLDGIERNERAKLPKLAKSSIKTRKYLERFNSSTTVFRPGRSNLTFTGQLLDSVTHEVKDGKVFVSASGEREPYKTGGQGSSKTPSNDELAGFLEKKGFFFLGIDDKTIKKIKTIAVRQLRRLLRS